MYWRCEPLLSGCTLDVASWRIIRPCRPPSGPRLTHFAVTPPRRPAALSRVRPLLHFFRAPAFLILWIAFLPKCINIECIMGAEQFFVARQPSGRYPCADQDLGSRKPRRWKFCVRDANRFKKQKVIRKLVRKPFSEHGLAHDYARSGRLAGPIFGGAGIRWECRGNAPGTHWERRPKARVLASNGPFCASNARVLEFRQFMRDGHVKFRLPAADLSQRPPHYPFRGRRTIRRICDLPCWSVPHRKERRTQRFMQPPAIVKRSSSIAGKFPKPLKRPAGFGWHWPSLLKGIWPGCCSRCTVHSSPESLESVAQTRRPYRPAAFRACWASTAGRYRISSPYHQSR